MGRRLLFPFSFTMIYQEIAVQCAVVFPCMFLLAAGNQVYESGRCVCALYNPGPGDGEAGQVQRSREVSIFLGTSPRPSP